jgi:hypothetical protein
MATSKTVGSGWMPQINRLLEKVRSEREIKRDSALLAASAGNGAGIGQLIGAQIVQSLGRHLINSTTNAVFRQPSDERLPMCVALGRCDCEILNGAGDIPQDRNSREQAHPQVILTVGIQIFRNINSIEQTLCITNLSGISHRVHRPIPGVASFPSLPLMWHAEIRSHHLILSCRAPLCVNALSRATAIAGVLVEYFTF